MTDSITDRIDAAFERAHWRFPESPLHWIYLTADDWRAYDAAMRADWPTLAHCFSYRDVQIRPGKKSRLVTKHGCIVAIPQRLSPRVRVAA